MTQLNGLRILNTRPKEQASALHQQIQDAGGISIVFPTIEIKESYNEGLALPNLNEFKLALFISSNAVGYFFKLLAAKAIQWPKHIEVLALGESTALSLKQHHIHATTPLTPDSEHILELINPHELQGKHVLLLKGEGGRTLIEDYLKKHGAHLSTLSLYQRILPRINPQWSNSIWQDNAVDIILITSEQSLQHLFKLFDVNAHPWLKNKCFLVISERLAQIASNLGIKNIKVSHPNRIINILLDYKDYIHGKQQ